jgi:hypothetical protein
VSKLTNEVTASREPEEVSPRRRGMTPVRVTLAAGVPQRWPIDGDYFHVLTAPVADLVARFDDGEPVPVYAGLGFRRYYQSMQLESATGQSVVVLAGFGSVADARATANVNVDATIEPGNTGDDGGDVACGAGAATQLLAADVDRRYSIIMNPSSNSVTVRIGTSAVAAATGIPLEPGTTLPYASTSAIYAWNPSGGAVTISAAAVKRV